MTAIDIFALMPSKQTQTPGCLLVTPSLRRSCELTPTDWSTAAGAVRFGPATPARTRSTIISRSNSAKMPHMPNIARPIGVRYPTLACGGRDQYQRHVAHREIRLGVAGCDRAYRRSRWHKMEPPSGYVLTEPIKLWPLAASLVAWDTVIDVLAHNRPLVAIAGRAQLLKLHLDTLSASRDARVKCCDPVHRTVLR